MGTTESRKVVGRSDGGGDQLAVGVYVYERGASVLQPPESVERDVPRAADDYEPAQLVCAVQPPGASLAAEAVFDDFSTRIFSP